MGYEILKPKDLIPTLKDIRLFRGIPSKFAALTMGMTSSQLAAIENERNLITCKTLFRLMDFYKIKMVLFPEEFDSSQIPSYVRKRKVMLRTIRTPKPKKIMVDTILKRKKAITDPHGPISEKDMLDPFGIGNGRDLNYKNK